MGAVNMEMPRSSQYSHDIPIGKARVKGDLTSYLYVSVGPTLVDSMLQYAGQWIELYEDYRERDNVFMYDGWYWDKEWLEDVEIFQHGTFIQYEEE